MAITSTNIRAHLLLLLIIVVCNLAKAHNSSDNHPVKKQENISPRQKNTGDNLFTIGASYYVKANATGTNTGASWQDAYTSLATALLNCAVGDTIRVAQGTYIPSGGAFVLKDGIVILGGYANTGNPTDQDRNWSTYKTILSGEAGNPFFNFDNLPNIVTGTSLTVNTIFDGFIIESGFANNTLSGVAINLSNSSPQIKNCVFRNNSSYNSALGGSSIACQNSSDPVITNCYFVNNLDFGFGTVFAKTNCNPKLINCVFAGNDGRSVIFTIQSNPVVTNCTFYNNQIGNAVIPYNIRPGFIYADNGSVLTVSNSVFFNNKYLASKDTADISLNASSLNIVKTITQNYSTGNAYLLGVYPKFKDTNNIAGVDNLFFTADDGLQLERCSPAVNAGDNTPVTAAADLLQHTRVFNSSVDIGAYEYQAGNGDDLLSTANDSLVANREYTDQNGWTSYYKDCKLLMSIKKNGQQIGSINDGTFKVTVKTTPGYGTGTGTNLSTAAYVNSGISWTALNRYWTIRATTQPTDSILIRFPWSGKDLSDAAAINPAVTTPGQLVFYTVDSPHLVLGLDASTTKFHPYYNNSLPTTQSWKLSTIDSVQYAEYYVKKINTGGMGVGTGLNYGPIAAVNSGCEGINRTFVSPVSGTAYQWQADSGSGFVALSENGQNNGTNTNTLTLVSPATSNYGKKFRCLITTPGGPVYSPITVLKFEARWNGSVSTSWNTAANWNCGVVPDKDTDVIINGGAAFNPDVNAILSCRSVRISGNAVVTVAAGKKLTITGK